MAKSLAERLQLKTDKGLFINLPVELLNEIVKSSNALTIVDEKPSQKEPYQFIALLAQDSKALNEYLPIVWSVSTPESILWILYPKKSSGIPSDLNMMCPWDQLTQKGYRPVASAAINEIWSAIRFKPNHLIDIGKAGNNLIEKEFSEYIDIKSKRISLPPFMAEKLSLYPQTLETFNKLSYTNRKEYVMTILMAKQEKTKNLRMNKIIESLLILSRT